LTENEKIFLKFLLKQMKNVKKYVIIIRGIFNVLGWGKALAEIKNEVKTGCIRFYLTLWQV
jgi:hypothetical protein